MTVLLAATAASLFGIGTYLVLQRKLSRIIIGISLLSHGANVLIISSGGAGRVPIIGNGDADEMADPLPQALGLTSIVISFGVTALLLALAYRSWLLTADDEVQDDIEDDRIARGGAPDEELTGVGDPSEPDEEPARPPRPRPRPSRRVSTAQLEADARARGRRRRGGAR